MWYITIDLAVGRKRYRFSSPVRPLAQAIEAALRMYHLHSEISGSYQITATEAQTPPVGWEDAEES